MLDLEKCPRCGSSVTYEGYGSTLVGYSSPSGHNHDDNCVIHSWTCAEGHKIRARFQNVCFHTKCNWRGKTDCFCSPLGVWIEGIDRETSYF